MTIQQLAYLAAIARCGSYSSAAEELFISQSSLSKQILSLEKELGIQLISRVKRQISFTSTGKRVVNHANDILRIYDSIMDECRGEVMRRKQRIALGVVPVMNQYGITDALLEFEKNYPDYLLDVNETNTADILQMLDEGQISIGIIRSKSKQDSLYDIYPLLNDEFVLCVPQNHKLAHRERVSLSELKDDKFMLMNTDPYYEGLFNQMIFNARINPQVIYTKMRQTTINSYVKKGRAVSIMMSRMMSKTDADGLVMIPLEENTSLDLSMITSKLHDLSPGAKLLLKHLLGYKF